MDVNEEWVRLHEPTFNTLTDLAHITHQILPEYQNITLREALLLYYQDQLRLNSEDLPEMPEDKFEHVCWMRALWRKCA